VHSVKTNIQTRTCISIAVSGCTGRTTASRPPVGGVRIRTWSVCTLDSITTWFWAWSPTTPRTPSSVYWKTRYIYIYKVTMCALVDCVLLFFCFLIVFQYLVRHCFYHVLLVSSFNAKLTVVATYTCISE
jgi:hypothetical protein